jgi:2,4-dienoyl-CoA reductase-like NADH-dependent reductase (Old Yellow Enzyme family)
MMLFEPLDLRGCRLRNRIAMSPMTQRAASSNGLATDWHLVHYGSRAVGGCGLVLVEDTAVQPSGRTSAAALGLYDEAQASALARVARFCKEHGAAVGIQLAHAGRKALGDSRGSEHMSGASAQAYAPGWRTPKIADDEDLAGLLQSFADAARLAHAAGFDAVEIHAGHGFLLHQFLSPLVNCRGDRYGGSPRNRARLLLEVVEVVRANWPTQQPLLVRLPAGDGAQAGSTPQEMVEVAIGCAQRGADLIDIAGGSPLFRGPRAQASSMISFAKELQSRSASSGRQIATAIGGGVEDGLAAERLLRKSGAALVTVGRPLLRNPYWALTAAEQLRAADQGSVASCDRG